MSELINLIILANNLDGCSNVSVDVTTRWDHLGPRPRVTANLPAADYPKVGDYGSRISVSHLAGQTAYLWIVGDPGEAPEDLLHELIDYVTHKSRRLVETEVTL